MKVTLLNNVATRLETLANFRYLSATETLELAVVKREIRKETKLTEATLASALGVPSDKIDQDLVTK
jgi:DNA-binding transcriptional regulator YiaG